MSQPRIYTALQFSPTNPEGRRSYITILVPANSFDEAWARLKEDRYLVGPGETYLLSDDAVRRGPACLIRDGRERHDAPTVAEHEAWVRAMTRPSYEDGVRCAPTYIRIG